MRKNTAKRTIIVLLLIASGHAKLTAQSIPDLDTVFSSLNNKDLEVSPIIRGVSIIARPAGAKRRTVDSCTSRSCILSFATFTVVSFEPHFTQWIDAYDPSVVLKKLYPLLEDSTKDYYANVLMYELEDNKKLGKFWGTTREQWVRSGRRECDMEYWRETMNAMYLESPHYASPVINNAPIR